MRLISASTMVSRESGDGCRVRRAAWLACGCAASRADQVLHIDRHLPSVDVQHRFLAVDRNDRAGHFELAMLRLFADMHLALFGRQKVDGLLDRLRQRSHDLRRVDVRARAAIGLAQVLDLVRRPGAARRREAGRALRGTSCRRGCALSRACARSARKSRRAPIRAAFAAPMLRRARPAPRTSSSAARRSANRSRRSGRRGVRGRGR